MAIIKIPVKSYTCMQPPTAGNEIKKHRFYADTNEIPSELLDWMSTNPREQNLDSPVAKTIAGSLKEPHEEFHLRNRGILLSAKSLTFEGQDGEGSVSIELEDLSVHGDIDGGHTLRIILAAEKPLTNKYVEFEVLTGLASAVEIAEARNTSVALDLKSMEEMKNAYAVLKETFEGQLIGGDPFFQRVEWKQNQQHGEKNPIDVRTIISILLMFNQDLYPAKVVLGVKQPLQMYGGKETALKSYLSLGETPEKRDEVLRHMAPVFLGILQLWDAIECGFGHLSKAYPRKRFVMKAAHPVSLFSNKEIPYYIPQALLFPLVAAFRALIRVDELTGDYTWSMSPLEVWENNKLKLHNDVLGMLKTFKDTPTQIAKNSSYWRELLLAVAIYDRENTKS